MLLTRSKEADFTELCQQDVEKKAVKEILKATIKKDGKHQHQVLTRFNLKKSLRVLAWIPRFISNCQITNDQERKREPIVAEETETQLLKMIKQYQLEFMLKEDFQRQKESLNQ